MVHIVVDPMDLWVRSEPLDVLLSKFCPVCISINGNTIILNPVDRADSVNYILGLS